MKSRARRVKSFRLWFPGLVLISVFPFASPIQAIEFAVIGAPTVTVLAGQSFTIDIAIDNLAGDSTQLLLGEITGLAAAGAVVSSGQTAVSHFVGICFSSACFGGLNTEDNPFFDPNDLSASAAYTPGDDSIQIVAASALSPTSGSGAIDPGLDGPLDMPSVRDVTISLVASVIGSHVLAISGSFVDPNTNTQVPISSPATFTINVVPEPGTALLIGFGLVGLGLRRRDRQATIPGEPT